MQGFLEFQRTHDIVQGEVLTIDGYGNLVTNLRAEDLPSSPKFEIGGHAVSGLSQHFQSDAALVAVLGSSGFVELANSCNRCHQAFRVAAEIVPFQDAPPPPQPGKTTLAP